MQLRGFLGATDEGGYAFAEMTAGPGQPLGGSEVRVDAHGLEQDRRPLTPGELEGPLALARAASAPPARVAEEAFAGRQVPGHRRDAARLLPLASEGSARIDLEPVPGAAVQLEIEGLGAKGHELRVGLRLAGGAEALTLRRLPKVGLTRASGLLLLPRERRALLLVGSASGTGGRGYRLETLSELELGVGLARLLDARAIEAMGRGEARRAREDLLRAVEAAPRDPVAHYNLACVLALLGEEDQAILSLGRAVELDESLKLHALRDPDLDRLRSRVEFRLMIEPRAGPRAP